MPPLRKIGILGGSFNPVHCGHMMLAQYIAEFTDLDEVWLSLSPQNPLKPEHSRDSDVHRFEMLRLACCHTPSVKATDIETHLPRPSYTAATLHYLSDKYPEYDFTLIIGSDNWLIFDRWKNYRDIISNHKIMIYPRPGYEITEAPLHCNVEFLRQAPICNISSTFIRNAISEGRCINQFLTPEVYRYITDHNLYCQIKRNPSI